MHRPHGLIQRIGHSLSVESTSAVGNARDWRRKPFVSPPISGATGGGASHPDQRNAQLIGERRQHVGLGNRAPVDQNLADFIAPLPDWDPGMGGSGCHLLFARLEIAG